MPLAIVFLTGALLAGCVSTQTHEEALNALSRTQRKLDSERREADRVRRELAAARKELKQARAETDRTRLQLGEAEQELLDLEVRKQDLNQALEESELQMAMLREVSQETRRRNEIYAEFVDRLQDMIDGGQLAVGIRGGRMVIELPDNILFPSGSANLNPAGKLALYDLARVMSGFGDRRFQVEGHTDNRPIRSTRYPSNWELSAARALTVVHYLIEHGVDASNVSAAGFGEFQPRAGNDTPQGRQLNRRIEIVMQPNLEVPYDRMPPAAR